MSKRERRSYFKAPRNPSDLRRKISISRYPINTDNDSRSQSFDDRRSDLDSIFPKSASRNVEHRSPRREDERHHRSRECSIQRHRSHESERHRSHESESRSSEAHRKSSEFHEEDFIQIFAEDEAFDDTASRFSSRNDLLEVPGKQDKQGIDDLTSKLPDEYQVISSDDEGHDIEVHHENHESEEVVSHLRQRDDRHREHRSTSRKSWHDHNEHSSRKHGRPSKSTGSRGSYEREQYKDYNSPSGGKKNVRHIGLIARECSPVSDDTENDDSYIHEEDQYTRIDHGGHRDRNSRDDGHRRQHDRSSSNSRHKYGSNVRSKGGFRDRSREYSHRSTKTTDRNRPSDRESYKKHERYPDHGHSEFRDERHARERSYEGNHSYQGSDRNDSQIEYRDDRDGNSDSRDHRDSQHRETLLFDDACQIQQYKENDRRDSQVEYRDDKDKIIDSNYQQYSPNRETLLFEDNLQVQHYRENDNQEEYGDGRDRRHDSRDRLESEHNQTLLFEDNCQIQRDTKVEIGNEDLYPQRRETIYSKERHGEESFQPADNFDIEHSCHDSIDDHYKYDNQMEFEGRHKQAQRCREKENLDHNEADDHQLRHFIQRKPQSRNLQHYQRFKKQYYRGGLVRKRFQKSFKGKNFPRNQFTSTCVQRHQDSDEYRNQVERSASVGDDNNSHYNRSIDDVPMNERLSVQDYPDFNDGDFKVIDTVGTDDEQSQGQREEYAEKQRPMGPGNQGKSTQIIGRTGCVLKEDRPYEERQREGFLIKWDPDKPIPQGHENLPIDVARLPQQIVFIPNSELPEGAVPLLDPAGNVINPSDMAVHQDSIQHIPVQMQMPGGQQEIVLIPVISNPAAVQTLPDHFLPPGPMQLQPFGAPMGNVLAADQPVIVNAPMTVQDHTMDVIPPGDHGPHSEPAVPGNNAEQRQTFLEEKELAMKRMEQNVERKLLRKLRLQNRDLSPSSSIKQSAQTLQQEQVEYEVVSGDEDYEMVSDDENQYELVSDEDDEPNQSPIKSNKTVVTTKKNSPVKILKQRKAVTAKRNLSPPKEMDYEIVSDNDTYSDVSADELDEKIGEGSESNKKASETPRKAKLPRLTPAEVKGSSNTGNVKAKFSPIRVPRDDDTKASPTKRDIVPNIEFEKKGTNVRALSPLQITVDNDRYTKKVQTKNPEEVSNFVRNIRESNQNNDQRNISGGIAGIKRNIDVDEVTWDHYSGTSLDMEDKGLNRRFSRSPSRTWDEQERGRRGRSLSHDGQDRNRTNFDYHKHSDQFVRRMDDNFDQQRTSGVVPGTIYDKFVAIQQQGPAASVQVTNTSDTMNQMLGIDSAPMNQNNTYQMTGNVSQNVASMQSSVQPQQFMTRTPMLNPSSNVNSRMTGYPVMTSSQGQNVPQMPRPPVPSVVLSSATVNISQPPPNTAYPDVGYQIGLPPFQQSQQPQIVQPHPGNQQNFRMGNINVMGAGQQQVVSSNQQSFHGGQPQVIGNPQQIVGPQQVGYSQVAAQMNQPQQVINVQQQGIMCGGMQQQQIIQQPHTSVVGTPQGRPMGNVQQVMRVDQQQMPNLGTNQLLLGTTSINSQQQIVRVGAPTQMVGYQGSAQVQGQTPQQGQRLRYNVNSVHQVTTVNQNTSRVQVGINKSGSRSGGHTVSRSALRQIESKPQTGQSLSRSETDYSQPRSAEHQNQIRSMNRQTRSGLNREKSKSASAQNVSRSGVGQGRLKTPVTQTMSRPQTSIIQSRKSEALGAVKEVQGASYIKQNRIVANQTHEKAGNLKPLNFGEEHPHSSETQSSSGKPINSQQDREFPRREITVQSHSESSGTRGQTVSSSAQSSRDHLVKIPMNAGSQEKGRTVTSVPEKEMFGRNSKGHKLERDRSSEQRADKHASIERGPVRYSTGVVQRPSQVRRRQQVQEPDDVDGEEMSDDDEGKTFRCVKCTRVFANEKTMKKHARWHEHVSMGKTELRCDECELAFVAVFATSKHISDVHMAKSYTCETCGMSFHSQSLLTKHVRSGMHFIKNTHKCNLCNAAFSNDTQLTRHRKQKHPEGVIYSALSGIM